MYVSMHVCVCDGECVYHLMQVYVEGVRHHNIYHICLNIRKKTIKIHKQIKTSISSGEYLGDSSLNIFLLMGVACMMKEGGGWS